MVFFEAWGWVGYGFETQQDGKQKEGKKQT